MLIMLQMMMSSCTRDITPNPLTVIKMVGFIKIVDNYKETNIHQCWDCESQGEFYVDESEVVESYIDVDNITDDDVKLH